MLKSISIMMVAAVFAVSSCKTGKKTGADTSHTSVTPPSYSGSAPAVAEPAAMPQTETKSLTRDEAKLAPESFRLVVTFISIGAGTDPAAKEMLDRYIADYKMRTGKIPAYVMIPWGREGEVDCCFNMNELSDSEQVDFIAGLRNSMKSRELIQINENARNRFRP